MVIIYPNMNIERRERLDYVLEQAGINLKSNEHITVTSLDDLRATRLTDEKILFAIALNYRGFNRELYSMLDCISGQKAMFRGSVAAVVVDGPHEEETKALARRLVYRVNESGCTFPGKALVEATGSLRNFNTVCKLEGLDEIEAYVLSVKRLIHKLVFACNVFDNTEKAFLPNEGEAASDIGKILRGIETTREETTISTIDSMCMDNLNKDVGEKNEREAKRWTNPGETIQESDVNGLDIRVKSSEAEDEQGTLSTGETKGDGLKKANLLVITSGKRATSNTIALWHKVESYLPDEIEIDQISLKDGEILECRGCPYEECLHLGEAGKCFYGGLVTEKIYSAIIRCNALLVVAPNYNDALSADFTAFINRLTALYRVYDFSEKSFFAIIVSGYSGGDILAQQLIGALNFNKNMMLPPEFSLRATANAPGSLMEDVHIDERAKAFADRIKNVLMCD